MKTKVVRATCLGIVLALVSAVPALAEGPTRVPLLAADVDETPKTATPPPPQYCPFRVKIEFLNQNTYGLVFTDRIIASGRVTVRVTNLETGESVEHNISGPGVFTFLPDGSLLLEGGGPWFIYLPEAAPGDPGLWFTTGRLTGVVTTEGHLTDWDVQGTVTDVCALLA
jgi:hypothetical protein